MIFVILRQKELLYFHQGVTLMNLKKMLIVDDDENLTWSIAKNLRHEYQNYEIDCANSGDEAIEILKEFSFNLVISDIKMPCTNGLQLLDYVKKNCPEARVIMMTSLYNSEIKDLANQNSGIYFIEKPFEMTDFKKIIHRALETDDNENNQMTKSSLKEIIKSSYKNKFNGIINVINGNKSVAIYFNGGEIIHAKAEKVEGEMALINVLHWSDGQYEIVIKNDPIELTIHYGWKLLLEKDLLN